MRRALLTACLIGAAAAAAEAQTDPIRCWWRTSQGAVSIGEAFEATLTCAVREQDTTRTVPDESPLAAAVVQLAPFEVHGGSHPTDLRSPAHRFFQYQYALRIIDRDVIGHDAKFPDLQLTYRVHTLTNGEWMAGRDRTYIIPGRSVRVLSLVPVDASDIRDSGDAIFEQVEALRFRARTFELAAYALFVVGLIVAAPAALAIVRRRRPEGGAGQHKIPRRAIWHAVSAELAAVERECQHGWTEDLVARAVSALRLAAAAALERDVAFHPLNDAARGAGRLRVSSGILQKRRFEIWSPLTPPDIRRLSATSPHAASLHRQQALVELANALATLSAPLYRASFGAEDTRLNEALAIARGVFRRLRGR